MVGFMNPRLIKFMVELQNQAPKEKDNEYIYFNKGGGKKLFDRLEPAKVTIPIKND